jgi:hypothetical protein
MGRALVTLQWVLPCVLEPAASFQALASAVVGGADKVLVYIPSEDPFSRSWTVVFRLATVA